MLAEAKAVLDESERDAQFREIGPGLTAELLRAAVRAGHERSLNCTAFNSKAGAGFTRWDSTVAELRERLSAEKWELCDEGNLPTIVSPSGRWQIAASSADEATGRPGRDPKTARPKGGEFQAHVHANQMSLAELEPSFPQIARRARQSVGRVTCMLLYHVDERNHEVRMELSIPDGFDHLGRVSSFKKRFKLEPLKTPQPIVEKLVESAEEAEVRVERRAN